VIKKQGFRDSRFKLRLKSDDAGLVVDVTSVHAAIGALNRDELQDEAMALWEYTVVVTGGSSVWNKVVDVNRTAEIWQMDHWCCRTKNAAVSL
jgi:hypothetical protein